LFVGRKSNLPVRVETLAADRSPRVYSILQKYEGAKLEGVSLLAFPKLAHQIDLATVGKSDQAGEVKIAIEEAFGYIDEEQVGRVFDLRRLINGLRPDRIEGELPGLTAQAGDTAGH
jgi:hypothetical protein